MMDRNYKLDFFEERCPYSGNVERLSITLAEVPIIGAQRTPDYKVRSWECSNDECSTNPTQCKLYLRYSGKR